MISGERMYAGVGSRVVEFGLRPVLRQTSSSDLLPGPVEGLAAGDGLLVAALGASGLAVLRPGPAAPQPASVLELPGRALSVAVVGDTAYVAAGPGGLRVVDLTDASRPREQGTALALHHVRDVAVRSGVAYVAAADEGLVAIDVSDPDAPREIGDLFTGGFAYGLEILGSTAYVADGWGGLRVIDLVDPRRPRLVGTLRTHGWAMDVAVRGGLAYVAAGAQGLLVVDVADPASPATVGGIPLSGQLAARVIVDGDLAYVADPFEGLQLVDVRSPAKPGPVATWQPLLGAEGIAVADGYAYVAGSRSGLVVVDASDPVRPRYVDALPSAAEVVLAQAVDGNVMFASGEGPTLFWADAIQGRLVAEAPFAWHAPMSAAVRGSLVVFADEEGVVVVDGSDPAPCRLAFYQTNFFPDAPVFAYTRAIALAGSIVYVSVDWEGIHVLDISEPRAPRLLAKVPSSDPESAPSGLVVIGDRLYAQDRSTLLAFDVSDPARPTLAATLELGGEPGPIWPRSLTAGGGYLFVTLGGAEVVAIDVSDPDRPRIAGQLVVPGRALSVASDGARLYVGSDEAGLLIAEWTAGPGSGSSPPRPRSAADWDGMVAPLIWSRPDLPPLDAATASPPAGCVVTSTEEQGPGSLVDCLGRVGQGQAVVFDPDRFSPQRPATIRVSQELHLDWGATIDGGGGVILDGGGEVGVAFSLCCAGDLTARTIRGLRLRGFAFAAVHIESDGNLIEGNVMSGNYLDIDMGYASGNRIVGNHLGVDATGTRVVRAANSGPTVLFISTAASMNWIEGNVMGGDLTMADWNSRDNTIVGNRVGVGPDGRTLPCRCILSPGAYSRIGGSLPGEGNLIAGGVHGGWGENVLLGNAIDGQSYVLWLRGQRNTVGGRAAGSANRIGGGQLTDWPGIEVASGAGQNTLIGNAVGGARIWIRVRGTSNAIVANTVSGGTDAIDLEARGNLVSGNAFIADVINAGDRSGGNRWDQDGRGNHWSDFASLDADGDGVGDEPRAVPPEGVDRYPLMRPPPDLPAP